MNINCVVGNVLSSNFSEFLLQDFLIFREFAPRKSAIFSLNLKLNPLKFLIKHTHHKILSLDTCANSIYTRWVYVWRKIYKSMQWRDKIFLNELLAFYKAIRAIFKPQVLCCKIILSHSILLLIVVCNKSSEGCVGKCVQTKKGVMLSLFYSKSRCLSIY